MNTPHKPPAMSQEIFNLGLSVETVSVYLLCCSLEDSNTVISTRNLLEIWNSTPEALLEGLKDLEKRNIIRRIISDRERNNIYRLTDAQNWKLNS